MDRLDSGKDKIQKICQLLKSETLEPAKKEAEQIRAAAEEKGRLIIHEAEKKAEKLIEETHKKLQDEKRIFESNLAQASKMGIEALRQDIENKLFSQQFGEWSGEQSVDPQLQARIVDALVAALEKEGTHADLLLTIGKTVPKEDFLAALSQRVIDKIGKGEVRVGEFIGGIQLKLKDRNIVLDLSDEALRELLASYIRKDFRQLLFAEK